MDPIASPATPPPTDRLTEMAGRVVAALDDCILGQGEPVRLLTAAYLAGGHALLEGAPGTGKTLLARSFAEALGASFQRVQFTPDLMPSDVVGTNVYDQGSGTFRLVKGPVFTDVLMADEINRTPPKTQAALLEAMEEHQVTLDGSRLPLAETFFVVATQNPIEFEGTYPLPEAQLDRFLLRVEIPLPEHEAELEIYRRAVAGTLGRMSPGTTQGAILATGEAQALRRAATRVHVAEEMLDYLARLAGAVRRSPHVELAISPRGALALLAAARGLALLEDRDFITPDDFKRLLRAAWGHRLVLTAESELEGHSPGRLLDEVAAEVPVPK